MECFHMELTYLMVHLIRCLLSSSRLVRQGMLQGLFTDDDWFPERTGWEEEAQVGKGLGPPLPH